MVQNRRVLEFLSGGGQVIFPCRDGGAACGIDCAFMGGKRVLCRLPEVDKRFGEALKGMLPGSRRLGWMVDGGGGVRYRVLAA